METRSGRSALARATVPQSVDTPTGAILRARPDPVSSFGPPYLHQHGSRDHLVDHGAFGARPHDGIGELARPLAYHPHDFVTRSHDEGTDELVDVGAEDRMPQLQIEPLQQIARVVHRLTRRDRDLAQ